MKWEYGQLSCQLDSKFADCNSQGFVQFRDNGSKVSNQNACGCHEQLAKLGDDGWEIVGIDRTDHHLTFYFKRPEGNAWEPGGSGRRFALRELFAVNEGETILGSSNPHS
jgi:hypothetical protein